MSSSSCGSIEREADNQENMDELTLEEQAMTYGIADQKQIPQQDALKSNQVSCPVKLEYLDAEQEDRHASDSSKIVTSGLFSTSVPRSKKSEDEASSATQAARFLLTSENNCY